MRIRPNLATEKFIYKPGYATMKSGMQIPEQFVYKSTINLKRFDDPNLRKFSPNTIQFSKPRTQREDEDDDIVIRHEEVKEIQENDISADHPI